MTDKPKHIKIEDPTAEDRKHDHIKLAFESQTKEHEIDQRFFYEPLLAGHPDDTSIPSIQFLSKEFKMPVWVSSMTGGTALAGTINRNLAKACGEYGMGMGLGSCRSLLYSDAHLEDFQQRKYIGDQPFYANLGIAQLEMIIKEKKWSLVGELISKLEADGIIIHVNPLQEFLQPEGDQIIHPPIKSIIELIEKMDCKVIVKEVGQGMGYESLKSLLCLPIEAIAFGAHGGTNFSKIEMFRAEDEMQKAFTSLVGVGHTAMEMVHLTNLLKEELGTRMQCHQIIISGGVRSFLDGYHLTQLSDIPSIYGQASGFLKHAMGSYEELQKYVETQKDGLAMAYSYLKLKKTTNGGS